MCKHVLNAQVSIRAPCCRRWFDCPECHAIGAPDHPLKRTTEMTFACKKCKKVFRKDLANYEEEDEYCPHCDNKYVLAAVTPTPELQLESSDPRVESRFIRDHRMPQKQNKVDDPDENKTRRKNQEELLRQIAESDLKELL